MLKTQLKFIITIVLVLGLSISLQSLIASWQAPTDNPPDGNIKMPINTGIVEQTKSGSLILGSELLVAGTSTMLADLIVGGKITGDGSGINNVEWGSIVNKPDFSSPTIYYSNCAYTGDNICPTGQEMRGFDRLSSKEAYCCDVQYIPCVQTAWVQDSSYCSASCPNENTTVSGILKCNESMIETDCSVSYRTIDCGPCIKSCVYTPPESLCPAYYTPCVGECCSPGLRCIGGICDSGDNTDTSPEELEFYKEKVLENRNLIESGKINKTLH